MKLPVTAIVLLALSVQMQAQPGSQAAPSAAAKVDPKLHADTVKLIELSGMKKRLEDGRDKSIAEGKKALAASCPMCTPGFADEWSKRMTARFRADDYAAVYVQTYEKYFNDSEILELTAMQGNAGAAPSPALKAKVATAMSSLTTEVYARSAQLRAKISGQVTDEIGKEHPAWVVRPPASPDE